VLSLRVDEDVLEDRDGRVALELTEDVSELVLQERRVVLEALFLA